MEISIIYLTSQLALKFYYTTSPFIFAIMLTKYSFYSIILILYKPLYNYYVERKFNMDVKYGKIVNGKLFIASDIIVRHGKLIFDIQSLAQNEGYKEVKYVNPPKNKLGYELRCSWKETPEAIVQEWNHHPIQNDYSGELLVSIRNFDTNILIIQKKLKDNYNSNDEKIKDLLENTPLIKLLFKTTKKERNAEYFFYLLHECHLNLKAFFEKINLKDYFESKGCYFTDYYMCIGTEGIKDDELQDITIEKFLHNKVLPQYFKSNLYNLMNLENRTTSDNVVEYRMSFIYLFTLFDDVLLKIIRLICLYNRNWLISNSNITAKEIFEYNSIDDLHKLLADKKVNELSWGSYSDKLDFLTSKGIKIKDEYENLFKQEILFYSVKRNIIVHNDGIWNDGAKQLLKDTQYFESIITGQKIEQSLESFEKAYIAIQKSVKYLYYEIHKKFKFLDSYSFVEIPNTNSAE